MLPAKELLVRFLIVRAQVRAWDWGDGLDGGGPVNWLPCSPDFSCLDFFLWSHMKSLVYASPVDSDKAKIAKVVVVAGEIREMPGVFANVRHSLRRQSNSLNGCGSPVVKVMDHGRHVTSSSPVPLKTRRVGQRFMLNLSRAETSSRWCSAVIVVSERYWEVGEWGTCFQRSCLQNPRDACFAPGMREEYTVTFGRLQCPIRAELGPEPDEIVNLIEEVIDFFKQINLEVHMDDVQELLDSHNPQLIVDELIEMHKQVQNIEEFERYSNCGPTSFFKWPGHGHFL
ncbi:uncharacterized protein TNCV_2486231 [Trichonephila clavipes]|uniref:Uncharacterized protein n=1 Tax=Trichonephila clavipes TaxID=2585209 RepID=A0A8X7BB99_TRICX|nr:uncharacterized protein TNCV_2486231 [Trichonephila clavipes]